MINVFRQNKIKDFIKSNNLSHTKFHIQKRSVSNHYVCELVNERFPYNALERKIIDHSSWPSRQFFAHFYEHANFTSWNHNQAIFQTILHEKRSIRKV